MFFKFWNFGCARVSGGVWGFHTFLDGFTKIIFFLDPNLLKFFQFGEKLCFWNLGMEGFSRVFQGYLVIFSLYPELS